MQTKLISQGIEVHDDFDVNDPANMGRPIHFSLKYFIVTIEALIASDEIQTALWLLDNPPGWWRDNYPKELSAIKKKIYEQTYDQIEYSTDDDEANCEREFGESQWLTPYTFPRAEIITADVKALNEQHKTPWIFDLGCSHGNLGLGLKKQGCKFDYYGKAMNYRISEKVRGWLDEDWKKIPSEGQEKWLVCTEVIEHCFNPHDIVHSSYKLGVDFDRIYLSVPYGTLGGGLPDWSTRRIGHVRTWTGKEFSDFATTAFPGYKWTLFKEYSMVLRGVR